MLNRRQIFAAGLALSPLAWAQSEKPLILGQSAPFTGPSQLLGSQFNQGAHLYFDALNESGGINGRTIALKSLDDGSDPARCVANTRKFIADGAFALFGYVGTPTTLAALPIALEAKIPLSAPDSGAQALREPFNRLVVHIRASNFDETAAMIKQANAVGIKRIAVFYQNDALGKAGLDGVLQAMGPLNLKPVATGTVEHNASDVTQALKDILGQSPEAIIQIGSYKSCAAFVRQARQARYGGFFYNVSSVGTQALLDELGAVARGVIVSQVVPSPYSASTSIGAEYRAALLASGSETVSPNYSGMEGFIAAKAFAEVLRGAGKGPSRDAFVSALQGLQNFNVGGMVLDYGPKKNTGSKFVEMTVLTEDGKVRR